MRGISKAACRKLRRWASQYQEAVAPTLSLEGIPQTGFIAPARVLTLVRPGNNLVLRGIRNLKCCAQARGCNITTPRFACNLPRSCVSARRAKNQGKKGGTPTDRRPNDRPTIYRPTDGRTTDRRPTDDRPTTGRRPGGSKKRVSGARLAETKAATGQIAKPQIEGSLCCSHTPARSILDFESFAGRGRFLDGRASEPSQAK